MPEKAQCNRKILCVGSDYKGPKAIVPDGKERHNSNGCQYGLYQGKGYFIVSANFIAPVHAGRFKKLFRLGFKKSAYNVPAVYDVLTARISKCVAFAGRAKCAGATAWEWSEAK
jgi:hypothetical protein